jgi:dCTP deaminase
MPVAARMIPAACRYSKMMRSRFARLGLVIHVTAPTIHNTFRGRIALEMMNHGPLELVLTPDETRICQLIFERIE